MSVLLGLSHFVSFGVSLYLACGAILVSSSSISMLSVSCMLSSCVTESLTGWHGWGSVVVVSICCFPFDSLECVVSIVDDCVLSFMDVKSSVISLHSDDISLL